MEYNNCGCDAFTSSHTTEALGGATMTGIIPQPKHNRICGVYEITNTVNGKRYIGSSVDVTRRFMVHKRTLNQQTHRNEHLQRAWNLAGKQSFLFKLLFVCDSEMVRYYEQTCLDKLHPEYNISIDATCPQRGRPRSEDEKQRISDALTGKQVSGETRRKLSIALTGNRSKLGMKHSEETKQKISEGNKGKIMPEHVRRILHEANTGRSHTEEARRKISETSKKVIHGPASEETRQKMSVSHKGHYPTGESCRKRSESMKRYWEEKRSAA